MTRLQPLILAYDAECGLCRRWMDWIQRRDRWGLIVGFPVQNPELIRMAPELAGLPLLEQIHGVDVATRQVRKGAELLPGILRRLPKYRFFAFLLGLPGLRSLSAWIYASMALRRKRIRIR